jgi:hypothetical protein
MSNSNTSRREFGLNAIGRISLLYCRLLFEGALMVLGHFQYPKVLRPWSLYRRAMQNLSTSQMFSNQFSAEQSMLLFRDEMPLVTRECYYV